MFFYFEILLLNCWYGQFLSFYFYQHRIFHKFICNGFDFVFHGRREHHGMTFFRTCTQDCFDVFQKAHVQHFICFVQYYTFQIVQTDSFTIHVVHQTARSCYYNLWTRFQFTNLTIDILSAIYSYRTYFQITAQFFNFFFYLNTQFSGWSQNQYLQYRIFCNHL